MPQLSGEVNLLTLFADVHYYFGPPSAKPPHHRFDKSSYIYLYHNPIQQRGRIEIANHAGTADQDAFSGYLDTVQVNRTHKHPCLFTITVEALRGAVGTPPPSPHQDMTQWHLPAPDQRNEGKYMFKLHTVDLYFWTADDATMFSDSLKRCVQDHQYKEADAPTLASEHRDSTMSPVVQKLEQAAITQKPMHDSRSSISSTNTPSFSGPATAMTPASTTATSPPPSTQAPASFTPMAYNPAAPPAPEPIAHREKTPPPPDAESGTGLAAAVVHDQPPQFAGPPQPPQAPQGGYGANPNAAFMPGPPSRSSTQQFAGPPIAGTPPNLQRSNTAGSFPPPPPAQTGSAGPPPGQQYAQSFAPPPTDPYVQAGTPPQPGGLQRQHTMPASYGQYGQQPPTPSAPPQYSAYGPQSPPLASPGYPPMQSPGPPPPNPQAQLQIQQQPAGGYSQYQYGQDGQQTQQGQYGGFNVHQQAYQPTQQEYGHGGQAIPGSQPQQSFVQQQQSVPATQYSGSAPGRKETGRLDKHAKKLEKGVGGFLKKLDKKF